MDSIRFSDKGLFVDIKSQAAKEGYTKMEHYIKMLHTNRKIYFNELETRKDASKVRDKKGNKKR